MLYTPLTIRAIKLAWEAHSGQTDKTGLPYILHPFSVAFGMADENTACAALLHDVVEDTSVTLDDIRAAGFPEEVVRAVSLLTHAEGVPYEDYVRAIKPDPVARAVKLADLRHNMDPGRLPLVTDEDRRRLEKYRNAEKILLGKE